MDEIIKVLKEQLLQLLAVAPSLIKALAVFVLGWILANFLAKVVKRILSISGVDALAEKLNSIDLLSESNIRIVPSHLVSKILYYLISYSFLKYFFNAFINFHLNFFVSENKLIIWRKNSLFVIYKIKKENIPSSS